MPSRTFPAQNHRPRLNKRDEHNETHRYPGKQSSRVRDLYKHIVGVNKVIVSRP